MHWTVNSFVPSLLPTTTMTTPPPPHYAHTTTTISVIVSPIHYTLSYMHFVSFGRSLFLLPFRFQHLFVLTSIWMMTVGLMRDVENAFLGCWFFSLEIFGRCFAAFNYFPLFVFPSLKNLFCIFFLHFFFLSSMFAGFFPCVGVLCTHATIGNASSLEERSFKIIVARRRLFFTLLALKVIVSVKGGMNTFTLFIVCAMWMHTRILQVHVHSET